MSSWARVSGSDHLVAAARRAGVRDARVLGALAAVERADFVTPGYAEVAGRDVPISIPHDQVTTQPSLVARMVEALALAGHEPVLEVGTGYGYQTALLARLAGEVHSVERWADLSDAARASLGAAGVANVELVVGDGGEGLAHAAPYEAIVVSAAFPQVPPPLVEQLAVGGRLVQPIGRGGHERVMLFAKRPDGQLEERRMLTGAHFVRLYGRHGFPASANAP